MARPEAHRGPVRGSHEGAHVGAPFTRESDIWSKWVWQTFTTGSSRPRRRCRGYERGLVELAERGVDIIVMDADLGASGGTGEFRKRFPDRFIDFGLSEQDMLGTAAGLSLAGPRASS